MDNLVLRASLEGHSGWVTAIVSSSENQNMIVSASRDKTIIVWELTGDGGYGVPKKALRGHSHFIQDLAISSDGQYVLSASWDKTLRLWDLNTGMTTKRFVGHTGDVLSVSFSADNRQIVSGSRDKTIKLWNTLGDCKMTIQEGGHSDWVSCVRFSPSPSNLITVSAGWDKFVKVWELSTCKLRTNYIGHTGYINTVTVSPDGSLCASGGKDSTVMLWDLNESKHLYSLDAGDIINALVFSPNRYWLCAATVTSIKVFDLETKIIVDELKVEFTGVGKKSSDPECISLCWSADGQTLFSGYTDNIIRFIHDIFIEQSSKTIYVKDNLVVKWTLSNEYGLIVYSEFAQIVSVEEFLENIKKLFCELYSEKLQEKCFSEEDFNFDSYFDIRIKEFESLNIKKAGSSIQVNENISNENLSSQDFDSDKDLSDDISKTSLKSELEPQLFQISQSSETNISFLKKDVNKRTPNKKLKKGIMKMNHSNNESTKKNKKLMRKWEDDSILSSGDKMDSLDYSSHSGKSLAPVQNDIIRLTQENCELKSVQNGFIIRELDDDSQKTGKKGESIKENHGGMFNIFTNLSKKRILSLNDLAFALTKMNELLLKKNIAKEVADSLCESVQNSLVGKNISTFQSVQSIVKTTMESSLKQILTPSISIDLLKEINFSKTQKKPYTISFVGVNGVGKSTSLSKIAFWLLKNHLKIIIAACDTFRSGAIEQLQVHVRNLQQLSEKEKCGKIELFEKGYGKDASLIAANAILYAKKKEFDIVLIDTSGRRHNDLRLMSPLEKLVNTNNIDRVFQVAEALAGTDVVAQAKNFNNALGCKKKLDGFIISKVDTVGNAVGTIVSIIWATGIPILFIGNGQTYTDIRVLSVSWVVKMLMS
ncbi:hypothetical protein PMAC_001484 [Pneumocystis sp. 'macacae']|nr:hypothetical protein PMAC_001484 [Pneumocystis sp. 'macacae']